MAGHWTDQFSFVKGALREAELGYLVLSNDEAAGRKIQHAQFVQWTPKEWGNGGQVKWRAAGVAVTKHPLVQMVAVGEWGDALLIGSGDRHEEKITEGKTSTADRGPLRGVRLIGDNIYVVGMDRQAYRREDVNRWVTIEAGLVPGEKGNVAGFEAVDGFDEQDIYAVGWKGEIWRFDGARWHRIDSPTSAVLVDVCCAGDGNVYAIGRNGLVVVGRGDAWRVHEQPGFSEDLWSVVWFDGKLYTASMDAVYVLQDGELVVVDMGKDGAKTCYHLAVGPGRMWSVGAKDVMAFDGRTWTRID